MASTLNSSDYNDIYLTNIPHLNGDSKETERWLEEALLDLIERKNSTGSSSSLR